MVPTKRNVCNVGRLGSFESSNLLGSKIGKLLGGVYLVAFAPNVAICVNILHRLFHFVGGIAFGYAVVKEWHLHVHGEELRFLFWVLLFLENEGTRGRC